MLAYPTSTDAAEALPAVLNFVEGHGTAANAAHACWVIVGYGVSLGLPDNPAPKPAFALDRKATLQVATGLANQNQLGAINWIQVVQIALQILTQILAGG